MWNVFDAAFITVTALYFVLRWKGLSSGDSKLYLAPSFGSPPHAVKSLFNIGSASDLGFDILACGACILFPRSDNNPILFWCRLTTPGQACILRGLQ